MDLNEYRKSLHSEVSELVGTFKRQVEVRLQEMHRLHVEHMNRVEPHLNSKNDDLFDYVAQSISDSEKKLSEASNQNLEVMQRFLKILENSVSELNQKVEHREKLLNEHLSTFLTSQAERTATMIKDLTAHVEKNDLIVHGRINEHDDLMEAMAKIVYGPANPKMSWLKRLSLRLFSRSRRKQLVP